MNMVSSHREIFDIKVSKGVADCSDHTIRQWPRCLLLGSCLPKAQFQNQRRVHWLSSAIDALN